MYWCYSCQSSNQCSNNCNNCSSEALQQITENTNPMLFEPYRIQEQNDNSIRSLRSLYQSIYGSILQAVGENRSNVITRVDAQGNQSTAYMFVINASEQEQIIGLTENQISKLQRKMISNECSVCQEISEQNGIILQCKHQFHESCLIPWIKTNGSCPTCRYKLVK